LTQALPSSAVQGENLAAWMSSVRLALAPVAAVAAVGEAERRASMLGSGAHARKRLASHARKRLGGGTRPARTQEAGVADAGLGAGDGESAIADLSPGV